MEEGKHRKTDLEDEMNRFEQEISSNTNILPPPGTSSHHQLPPPPSFPPSFRPPQLRGMPTFPGMPPPMPPPPMFGQPPMDGLPPMPSMPPMPPMPPGMQGMPPMMGMGPPPSFPGSFPPRPPASAPPQMNMSGNSYQSARIDPPTVALGSYDAPGEDEGAYDGANYGGEYVEHEVPSASHGGAEGSSGGGGGGGGKDHKKGKGKKKVLRVAGGVVWDDETLLDWDVNDFRLFVGDLGNEVSDDALLRAFSAYPSLLKAKVIRDKKTKKTKGFGFVSFKDPKDYLRAMREMNGKYVGNRPIKLRKSSWKERNINIAKKKEKEKKKLGIR